AAYPRRLPIKSALNKPSFRNLNSRRRNCNYAADASADPDQLAGLVHLWDSLFGIGQTTKMIETAGQPARTGTKHHLRNYIGIALLHSSDLAQDSHDQDRLL